MMKRLFGGKFLKSIFLYGSKFKTIGKLWFNFYKEVFIIRLITESCYLTYKKGFKKWVGFYSISGSTIELDCLKNPLMRTIKKTGGNIKNKNLYECIYEQTGK